MNRALTPEPAPPRDGGEARRRSGLWRLLAAAFDPAPRNALAALLKDPEVGRLLAEAGEEPEAAAADGEALAVEYARLFVGPGKHIPPFASVHLGEGELWGEATRWVRRAFEAAGYAPPPSRANPPDHIANAFEFLAELAAAEAAAIDAGETATVERLRAVQRRFLGDHLAAWAPAFCRRVVAESEHPAYRAVARIAEAFVLSESEALGGSDQGWATTRR